MLLRPAQQYTSQTPFEPGQATRVSQRLLTLTRGWEKLHGRGLDLATLESAEDVTLPDDLCHVQVQFYPLSSEPPSSFQAKKISPMTPTKRTSQADQSSQATVTSLDGSFTFNFDPTLENMSEEPQDRLITLAEESHMSVEDQLVALNKFRLVAMMSDRGKRRTLLNIRLLALATYRELQYLCIANVSLPYHRRGRTVDCVSLRTRAHQQDRQPS